jgi:hypothetical protein
MPLPQGDQIGAPWAVDYHGKFFISEVCPNFRTAFFHGKSYVYFLTKNGLGNLLGHIFTNSSGHPAVPAPRKCYPGDS